MDSKVLIGLGILALWYHGRGSQPVAAGVSPAYERSDGERGSVHDPTQPLLDLGGSSGSTVRRDPLALGSSATNYNPVPSANAWANYWDSIPVGDPGAGAAGRDPRYAPGVVNAGGGSAEEAFWEQYDYENGLSQTE